MNKTSYEKCNAMLIAVNTKNLLKILDVPAGDENFKDTPARVARMYNEILYPKFRRKEEIENILSKTFPSAYSGLIMSSGIRAYSLCGHHLLPIVLDVTIGYIPKKRVLGLSKLARLAEVSAKQLMIQENYTQEIAFDMMRVLKPEGVGVYVRGLHYCQTMRGVKQRNATMLTTSLEGCFLDASVKQEFLDYCRKENYAG